MGFQMPETNIITKCPVAETGFTRKAAARDLQCSNSNGNVIILIFMNSSNISCKLTGLWLWTHLYADEFYISAKTVDRFTRRYVRGVSRV